MKILLTGGGSGGHILPTLAVAEALKNKISDVEIWYVGSTRVSDRELVESAGFKYLAIQSGKLRRYFDLQNIVDTFRVLIGWWQAKNILVKFKPDVVFAKGGAVSLPVIIAAGQAGIPVVAHESDIVVGLTNRLAMRWISKLAVAFPVSDVLVNSKTVLTYEAKLVSTGYPIDSKLFRSVANRPFANGKPIVLITGGSLGASFINQIVVQSLPEILSIANIIHYTGRGDYPTILSYYKQLPEQFKGSWMVRGFDVEDFKAYLQGADLVVSRSGSFVMELEVVGKPAILVPLPTSASNHQHLNAEFLAKQGASVLIEQHNLTPDKLFGEIKKLLNDEALRLRMASKMKDLGRAHLQATEKIADLIIAESKPNL